MSDLDRCRDCADTGWLHVIAEALASDDTPGAVPVGGWVDVDYWSRCDCPIGRAVA